MPKASPEGTERMAAWCRDNARLDLTSDQAKELLERSVRFFYLAFRATADAAPAAQAENSLNLPRK